MADPESVVLAHLSRIDEKVDRLLDDVRDLKFRVTSVQENLAGAHRRMDRFGARLDRIERRLDLVDAHS